MSLTTEEYNKGGYAKFNLKRSYIEDVHNRIFFDGKVITGGEGKALKEKLLRKQQYLERNK